MLAAHLTRWYLTQVVKMNICVLLLFIPKDVTDVIPLENILLMPVVMF